jgi:ubiquinone/menaquinone biosynthesis C-methylase UbiE
MPSDEVTRPARGDHVRTTEYFGRLATTYGDGRYYGLRRRAVIDAIASEVRAAHRLLDLGCGNGNYLAEFAAIGDSHLLVGADLTFDMLLQARARAPKAGGLVRADASALPFASRSFDVVFCSHVLPFVADLAVTLAEISRCLRDGGLLIATLPGDNLVRHEIEALIGAERYAEFARLAFQRRGRDRNPTASIDRYREAFARVDLRFEERGTAFEITWPDIAEWIRIRWFPVMAVEDRPIVDKMLIEIAASESRIFTMVEPFVIGRRTVVATP